MEILNTILPIFAVILTGWLVRQKGFMPSNFLEPANRLVFYLAIPAMIFRAIAGASLKAHFNGYALAITLFSAALIFGAAWGMGLLFHLRRREMGTFVQSAFHGNLGYIGLAVAFYFLGDEGLVQASIIAGSLMILQNLLAVLVLSFYGENRDGEAKGKKDLKKLVFRIFGNPIILSAVAGMLYSLSELPIPKIIDRSLDILSNMALPLALLIIGASLSTELIRSRIWPVLWTAAMKLLLLPALGLGFFTLFGLPAKVYLPGLILLASPTATVVYVMAKEMNGDADFAVAAISGTTLLSAVTFFLWLNIRL